MGAFHNTKKGLGDNKVGDNNVSFSEKLEKGLGETLMMYNSFLKSF